MNHEAAPSPAMHSALWQPPQSCPVADWPEARPAVLVYTQHTPCISGQEKHRSEKGLLEGSHTD